MTTLTIKIIVCVIWGLLGFIAHWRIYHGLLKEWFQKWNESLWDEDPTTLKLLLWASPIFIVGGLLTLLLGEFMFKYNTWWFTTKDKEKGSIY